MSISIGAPSEWLSSRGYKGGWTIKENRIAFLKWFEKQKGILSPSGWQAITSAEFSAAGGSALLYDYYQQKTIRAAQELYPDYEFHEWLFPKVPKGFWEEKDNRLEYLKWLEGNVEVNGAAEWHKITREDFARTGGGSLLSRYFGGSTLRAAKELYPQYVFVPWIFARVERGFWKNPTNRASFVKWAEQELGISGPDKWYSISTKNLKALKAGIGAADEVGGLFELICEVYDDFPFDASLFEWVGKSQKYLYERVKLTFPNEPILFNYRRLPNAIYSDTGRPLEMDIYLPNRKLAIEYQGKQHFQPVEWFGGETVFLYTQDKDKQKREILKDLGIILLEIRFDQSIDEVDRLLSAINSSRCDLISVPTAIR